MPHRRNMFLRPQGTSLDGARVLRIATHASGSSCLVVMMEDRRAYATGETLTVAPWDLVEALEWGDRVAYEPTYLAGNHADAREYKRRGQVVKLLEGTLVQVQWDDGLGPSTFSVFQLRRVP